jgi:hypothetical protein
LSDGFKGLGFLRHAAVFIAGILVLVRFCAALQDVLTDCRLINKPVEMQVRNMSQRFNSALRLPGHCAADLVEASWRRMRFYSFGPLVPLEEPRDARRRSIGYLAETKRASHAHGMGKGLPDFTRCAFAALSHI